MPYLKKLGFTRGVNLGGWMSQCDYSEERLERFITERDMAQIASWGLDHVRIPVDYNVFENEDGSWKDSGFARLNRAIVWCRQNGLNTVIDLHKTAGFSFDQGRRRRASLTAGPARKDSSGCGKSWQRGAQAIRSM